MSFTRKLILLTFTLLQFINGKAQVDQNKYEGLWKNVDALIDEKGLTKDALAAVQKIYIQAKKENQQAQIIKALIYQVRLQEPVEENAAVKSIGILESEIKNAPQPAVSILQSLLAEKYWNYFQQNRWKLYDRTQTSNLPAAGIEGWSIADFHKKISELYLASIQNKIPLQQTKLELYDPIIVKGNARYLRPTLFDLLANRAVEYFRNDERDLTRPAYAFVLNDEKLFSPAKVFSTLSVKTNDSLSLHQKALLIFQDLIAFHANDKNPDALIDADLARIQLVYQYGVMENKDSLYAIALGLITKQYPQEPAGAQASYLLAQWHSIKAAQYDPLKDTSNRYENVLAAAICENALKQTKDSEGKQNCLALLQQIRHREVSLQTEKINLPNQPFRSLVSFRNLNQLYLRIIPLTDALRKQLSNRFDDTYWRQLTALQPIRSWNQQLPKNEDYQMHHAEVKVDPLPGGAYILLAGINADFSLNKNPLAVQFFNISSISYINNGGDYFVLDRETGKPLPKAQVQVWVQKYDYTQRQNTVTKGPGLQTDQNGFFRLVSQQDKQQNNFRLDITYNKDRLYLEDNQYTFFRNEEGESGIKPGIVSFEKKMARSFIFTDRSIYRPGQTIYFKGIVITKDAESRKSKIYPGQQSVVKLFNANGEPSDSLRVTANEFGSYSGKFILPQNLLNGEFRISDETMTGESAFSVEEYKRPKFYIEYGKQKGSYKVNDSITVTGSAKAYAGNNVAGARGVYRIVRESRFIYPWLYWKRSFPRSSNLEIANGIVTTNNDGTFTLRFKAIPDLSINKQLDPVFDFKVYIDITDINGETRSNETTIPVSYKTLQLKLNVPAGQTVPADSLKNLTVMTQNLTGEFLPTLVNVSIYRLQAPGRLIRERYWQQPDQFVISKEEYLKNFPFDDYQEESDYRTWPKAEMAYEGADSSRAGGGFQIGNVGFKDGWYMIEASTKDKYGALVKDVQYVQVFNDKQGNLPALQYAWSSQNNGPLEPGDKSSITIGSSAADLFVIQQKDSRPGNPGDDDSLPSAKYEFLKLNNEKKTFVFDIKENNRGGFGVNHFFVKNNRFYVITNQVMVPWSNKELVISYESFRDKTLPGSEEKWKLKISGLKKEKLAAEMLASMYDASLDQFRPHGWAVPAIWPTYTGIEKWNGATNFTAVQSQEKYVADESTGNFVKTYDRMIPLGRNAYGVNIRGRSMMAQEAMAAPGGELNDVVVSGVGAKVMKMTPSRIVQDEEVKTANVATPHTQDPSMQIRKNFNETAFFIPDLRTDSAGLIEFGFTIPEALTRWKFQALAHTKDGALGYTTTDIVTQKSLMVQPNTPRFLREGDKLELTTKIVNMTTKEMTGTVHLELFNAATMQPVDGWFQNMTANQYFTAEAGQSVAANFSIQVPYQFNSALVYRFVASAPLNGAADSAAGKLNSNTGAQRTAVALLSDAEEASLPVLTNSMLVTESISLPVRGNGARNFRFEKLLQSASSETLHHQALTLEFTTNPSWYAVESLPYLAENLYPCSEQVFNRLYANALAARIANSSPRLVAIFEKWKLQQAALASNLEKNTELKSVLLEETPWVLDSRDEAQQRKNIALLFDMARMGKEVESAIELLQQFQTENGGFAWFKGGPDDRFITQYILSGIGHLKKLNALPPGVVTRMKQPVERAIQYLDKRMQEDYLNVLRLKSNQKTGNFSNLQVQYLYMRSFFSDIQIAAGYSTAVNYYREQTKKYWLQQTKYMQGMIALSLFRHGDVQTSRTILNSLRQNAIINEEMGMYWKENRSGYYWYQSPVETQSLLIEAFAEISRENNTVDELKTWLLKQKQTQHWPTTRATADACYALLLQGTDWLAAAPAVEIKLGEKTVRSNDVQQEAGTGYFKKRYDAPFVNASMGEISVKVSSSNPPVRKDSDADSSRGRSGSAWGAVYWQYFENLDKITSAATPLRLVKKLFVEKNSDRGPVLTPVHAGEVLHTGDKIKVRIELTADRDMEYLHMKDMRASCMEPTNVLSTYKWQGGLGYYETTKDASTSFFFHWLPKGNYVFEYSLFVTNPGNFSNGVTTIQSMYAPEFSSHSEGIRVNVE